MRNGKNIGDVTKNRNTDLDFGIRDGVGGKAGGKMYLYQISQDNQNIGNTASNQKGAVLIKNKKTSYRKYVSIGNIRFCRH